MTFWGLTVENEPRAGGDPSYGFQALNFTAETERDFVRDHLGPTLSKSSIGKYIKLMIMDDQRNQLPTWPDTVVYFKTKTYLYLGFI